MTNSRKFHFYPPQRSCGKVMLLHLSVILFTGVGGLSHTHRVYTPWADIPLVTHPLDRHPLG